MSDKIQAHKKYISGMVEAGLLSACSCDICQPKIEPPKVEYSALEAQIQKRLAELAGTLPSEEVIRQKIAALEVQKKEWEKLLIVVDVARPFANRIDVQAGRVLSAMSEADRTTPALAINALSIMLD